MSIRVPTRRLRLTPDRCVLLLLLVEALLFLSNWLGWPAWHKGYAVLTGVAVVGVAMLGMLAWYGLALVFRRRFQFGIRSLLVLAIIVAIPCSWMTLAMRKAQQQKAAVAALVKTWPNKVWYDSSAECHFGKLGSTFGWDFDGTGPQPQWLKGLVGEDLVSDVVAVQLHPVADSDIECLKLLPEIRFLELNTHSIDTHKALAYVKGLASLNVLDLEDASVTDADLEHLKGLAALRTLDLTGTRVTLEGVLKLQEALPNCEIYHSFR